MVTITSGSRHLHATLTSEMFNPVRGTIDEIRETFGDHVHFKHKHLLKFGRTSNADSGVKTTIMTLPGAVVNEVLQTTNSIDSISSSSGSDTSVLRIEGHTIDANGLLTFVVQDATLDGQTRVALATPLARVSRGYVLAQTFAAPAAELVGSVYFYENGAITNGVPDTDAEVHMVIEPGKNQSEKCATSVSNKDYFILTGFTGAIGRGSSSTTTVDFELEWRELGGVWRQFSMEMSLRASGVSVLDIQFHDHQIIPPNSDLRMVAISNSANTAVSGSFEGQFLLRQV